MVRIGLGVTLILFGLDMFFEWSPMDLKYLVKTATIVLRIPNGKLNILIRAFQPTIGAST